MRWSLRLKFAYGCLSSEANTAKRYGPTDTLDRGNDIKWEIM